MIDTTDPAAAVAAVVARESEWVPAWRRIVMSAIALALPGLVALAVVTPPGAATVGAVATLLSRGAPVPVARALRHGCSVPRVRRLRTTLLVWYAATGLLSVAALPRAAPDPPAAFAAGVALVLVVLQHRPDPAGPHLSVALEALEVAATVALLPSLALATRGWWQ